jgi:predicted nuclease of predicted toxin-antitoxin system
VKILLDENLPQKLRLLLTGHTCLTAGFMGWSGVQNGDLLLRAAAEGFDAFITTDRGLEYEQNQAAIPIAIVVLLAKDNKLATLEALVPSLLQTLSALVPKRLVKVKAGP